MIFNKVSSRTLLHSYFFPQPPHSSQRTTDFVVRTPTTLSTNDSVARSIIPGDLGDRDGSQADRGDLETLLRLISDDLPQAVQLIAAISLCSFTIVNKTTDPDTEECRRFINEKDVVQGLRHLASSSDPHIYLHAGTYTWWYVVGRGSSD